MVDRNGTVFRTFTAATKDAAEQPIRLPSKPPTEQIIRDDVDGRIQRNQKVPGFVESVQTQISERSRIADERPDDARDERRSLTDEEHEDDADQHHGRVVLRSPDGGVVRHRRFVSKPSPGQTDVTYEERVENDEKEQGDGADEDQVQTVVVDLAEQRRPAERTEVVGHAEGFEDRMANGDRLVFEELGNVEQGAADRKGRDHLASSFNCAEGSRLKWMANGDVPERKKEEHL